MRILTLTLLAGLFACSGSDDKSTDDSGPATTSGATSTGSTFTGVTTSDPDRNATMNGTIRDCAGAGLSGAEIRFCDPAICRNQTSGADGSFEYTNSLIGWNSFEVFGPDGSGLITGFVPVQLGDGEVRTVDMTLCPHDPFTALTGSATEVEHGEGLYITVSTALLEKPTPFDDDPTESGGLKVDPAVHVPADGITGTVVAQWFLEPFNFQAAEATGLDYRIDGTALGLSAASYHVYVGSYDDFAWLDAGTISDGDGDGQYTPDGDGLPLMGTVMIVEE